LYERTLRLHIYPRIGDRPIGSVRRSDVQALVAGLDLSPKTIQNVYKLLRAVFVTAADDAVIATTPCRKITRPAAEDRHVAPLDLHGVMAAADAISPRMRALVLLSVGSGLRQGEALGLTVDRIDFLRREVTVDRQLVYLPGGSRLGPLKTKASRRVVPLPTFVVDALAAHLAAYPAEPGGLVFTGARGQPAARPWLHRAWRAAVTAAGLPPNATWHLLRHTYASILIDGRESVTVVAKRLGHANPSETLRTYSHLWPDSDDRTRQVVEGAFSRGERLSSAPVMRARQ
jgi:integrase